MDIVKALTLKPKVPETNLMKFTLIYGMQLEGFLWEL